MSQGFYKPDWPLNIKAKANCCESIRTWGLLFPWGLSEKIVRQ